MELSGSEDNASYGELIDQCHAYLSDYGRATSIVLQCHRYIDLYIDRCCITISIYSIYYYNDSR